MNCKNKTCYGYTTADMGNCHIMSENQLLVCPGRLAFKKQMEILKQWGVDAKRLMDLVERVPVGVK